MTGYISGGSGSAGTVLKTSNAGLNWTLLTGTGTNWLFGIYFTDLMTGWSGGINGAMLKTTDGGMNWITQISGTTNRIVYLSFPNANTGYAVGYTGTIIKTTNGGDNWFTQTCPSPNNLWGVYFLNENTGWAVGWNGTIVHTTNGGVVTGIKQVSTDIPSKFSLEQNYPNPFNAITKIQFNVPMDSRFRGNDNVVLKVFDLLGREVATLLDEYMHPGTYEVRFDAGDLTSGVYFYRLQADNFTDTKRFIIIK